LQAQNPDELTIVENEQLEVVGEGDGDGWLRARNYRGEEGYVPHNYLDIEQDAAGGSLNGSSGNQLRSQISFSSVDYTVDNEDQTVDSMQSPDQVSVIMAPQKRIKSDVEWCIALYVLLSYSRCMYGKLLQRVFKSKSISTQGTA